MRTASGSFDLPCVRAQQDQAIAVISIVLDVPFKRNVPCHDRGTQVEHVDQFIGGNGMQLARGRNTMFMMRSCL